MLADTTPPDDPRASWLGPVPVIGRTESWPRHRSAPMAGIRQIDVGQLPHVPYAPAGVAMVSLFMTVGRGGRPDPDRWEVRTYFSLEDRRPADDVVAPTVRPFPVEWELVPADLPAWDDAELGGAGRVRGPARGGR